MRINIIILLAAVWMAASSCAVVPKGAFSENALPPAPDYSQPAYWAALPDRPDEADHYPAGHPEKQAEAAVDVFFLHPTIYTGKKGDNRWNGPVDDPGLNERVDESTIRYQASVFNNTGKVYAPRYRQAHLNAYYTRKKEDAAKAFELAYQDVRRAFVYFLENFNQGRPIILAAHSQGAQHGRALLREFFDGKPLQQQLVAAYLAGMPVSPSLYENLQPCQTPEQTGCFCSWRTFKKGYYPPKVPRGGDILSTNPLNWTINDTYAPRSLHKGAILRSFDKIYPEVSDAQNHQGLLWVSKPRFPGSFLITRRNYHVGDFNLFYMNVRENAALRASSFGN